MKKLLILVASALFICCNSVKNTYGTEKFDSTSQTNKYFLVKMNAEDSDKFILHFTTGFENDTIEIISGDKQIFKNLIKTTPELGFAHAETVSMEKVVTIKIYKSKTIKFSLDMKKLRDYKYVFISMSDTGINVEYTNIMKRFL